MEVKEGGRVVANVYDLTANQLIILLNHYRGTQNLCPVMGTDEADLEVLIRIGLIVQKATVLGVPVYEVTELGHSYINNILTVTVVVESKTKFTIPKE